MINSTPLIVLQRNPYRETAWIAAGISPDYGKFQVVVHGDRQADRKHTPVIDLFREVEVEFKEQDKSPLQSADRVELLTPFDAIAENPRGYKMVGKIGAFLMANSEENIGLPFTYDSFKSVLTQLTQPEAGWSLVQCSVVIKTVFLYENGLLPQEESLDGNNFLENLVAAGIDNSPLPSCREDYWNSLNNWLNTIIAFHGLKK